MKTFFLRLLIFSIIAVTVVTAPILYKKYIEKPFSFKISKSRNILILGDSHTECAIDDSVFTNAVNYSRSAETYLYSYVKLREFIAANDHINTVILSFSFYSLSDLQEYWYYRSDAIEDKIPRFIFFMNMRELGEIARLNPGAFYRSTFGATTRSMLAAQDLKELQLGGYMKLNRHALQEDLEILKGLPQSPYQTSEMQTVYLQKIIDFCRQKNLRLVLLNAPMYNGGGVYYMRDTFANIYKNRYADIPLLDYADFKMPDSCYGDASHLNYKGARSFSAHLMEQFGRGGK